MPGARHARVREIHRVLHVAVLQELAQLVGDHHRAVLLGFAGRCAQVRQRDHARVAEQVGLREVGHVAPDTAVGEPVAQRARIDDALSREVQQHQARPRQIERARAECAPGGVVQRHMEREVVGGAEQLVERAGPGDVGGQLPGTVDGHVRIETGHLHAECVRGVRDLDADRTEPDHTERPAGELRTHEALLLRLHALMQVVADAEPVHERQRVGEVACGEQHAGDDQFLDRVRVRARCVEHRHAARGKRRDRDIVGAGPGARDRLHAGRDRRPVHVGRTHQYRIRCA